MSKYSERAKRNMRKQINAQVRLLKSIVTNKTNELAKIKRYRKYHLPGQAKMERAGMIGLAQAKKDLKTITNRKAILEQTGKI